MQNRAHRPLTRLVVTLVGAAALTATAACATDGEPEAREAEEVAAREAEAHEARWRGPRQGPVEVLLEVARLDGALSAEQEAELDALALELEDERESFRSLHQELRQSAVRVVRADGAAPGELDRAIADGLDAIDARVQRSIDAVEDIHAVLEPDQRAAVADTLRDRLEARLEARRERRAQREERGEGLGRLASYLVLSPTQVQQLQALQEEMLGEKKQVRPTTDELHALIDAFEGEDLGAALDALHAQKGRVIRARVARAGRRADSALGIFTAEQRELLADLILEGPSKLLLGEGAAPRE